jgi:enoyl-CoA hydratase/carnithine racemase
MQMVLTGDPIDAPTAYRYGLVQRVVPRERLYLEAEALAQKVLSQPAEAVRLAKRAVVEGIELPLAQSLAMETRLAAQSSPVR